MFPFTLRQLEIFIMLCETGSFVETSQKFGISQPSISNQIQALENQLGFKLFVRIRGKSPKLSLEGEIFKKDAKNFIAAGNILAQHKKVKIKTSIKPINIYIGIHMFEDFFKPKLHELYTKLPDLEVSFVTEWKKELLSKAIKKGNIDIVSFNWLEIPNELEYKVIGKIGSGIYAHKNLATKPIEDKEISSLPFILPSFGSNYEAGIVNYLRYENILPNNVIMRSQYHDLWREMLSSGNGALYINDMVMAKIDCSEIVQLKKLKDWYQILYINPSLDSTFAQDVEQWVLSCLNDARLASENCKFFEI